MRYSIWRLSQDGEAIPLSTVGETSVKDRAFEKMRLYNERLRSSDPSTTDRFVVFDEKGREIKAAQAS